MTHRSEYRADQLCTIAAAGSLGAIAVGSYVTDRMSSILLTELLLPIFLGGAILICLSGIRMGLMWRVTPAQSGFVENHGRAPWRQMVLLLPVTMYSWVLPDPEYGKEWLTDSNGNRYPLLADTSAEWLPQEKPLTVTWLDLLLKERSSARRELIGKQVTVSGLLDPISDRELVLNMFTRISRRWEPSHRTIRVLLPTPRASELPAGREVWVTGQIQEKRWKHKERSILVLVLKDPDEEVRLEPPPIDVHERSER